MKKKGAGRPPLPKGTAKATTLLIRLSQEEKRSVAAAANASGKKASAWAREILLEKTQRRV